MDKKIKNWYRLDNAAKIFPPNSKGADTKVFRFSCHLKERVDLECLTKAANITLDAVPSFKCVLRKGLFWYYFDETDFRLEIKKESGSPCLPLYFDSTSYLFRISYYLNTINLEVYHALTDGVGAMRFFQYLINNYLYIRYRSQLPEDYALLNDISSVSRQQADSFDKYYSGTGRKKKPPLNKAYQLTGKKLKFYDFKVIEGYCPVNEIKSLSKGIGCSITELLCAVMIKAVRNTQKVRDMKLPVVVSMPVNLRSFFPSDSMRNFFSVYNVAYEVSKEDEGIEAIAMKIHENIHSELNKEYLQERMDYLEYFENALYTKLVPLILKRPVLQLAYKRSEKEYTTTVSNVGMVDIEEPLQKFIDSFSVFNSTRDLQICVCTFNERLCITFSSRLVSTEIEMEFFRILTSYGINIYIHSNRWEEEQ